MNIFNHTECQGNTALPVFNASLSFLKESCFQKLWISLISVLLHYIPIKLIHTYDQGE